jgi:hypothetical protein
MKLDLLDKVAEIVDVLAHCSLRRLLEVVKSLFKDAEFRITPCAVLHDEFLPRVGCRFTPNDSGVRGAVRSYRIKEVVEGETVSLIPLVNTDFVRVRWIGFSAENYSVSEIDFPGGHTGFDVRASGVGQVSGNDIPELVLNEETLRGMHPIVEVVRVELAERERRRFWEERERKRKARMCRTLRFWKSFSNLSIRMTFC